MRDVAARERSEPAEGGGGSGRASEPRGAKAPQNQLAPKLGPLRTRMAASCTSPRH